MRLDVSVRAISSIGSHGLKGGVAAAEHQAEATLRQLSRQVSGQRQRPGRLERQVKARPRHTDRAGDLVFGHGHDLVHQPVDEHRLEVARADGRRANAVGERLGRVRERLDAACFPAPVGIVRGRRLYPNHLDGRPVVLGRDRGAREKSAAADRGRDGIEVGLIFQQLTHHRSLAVDHVPVVERMDQLIPALRHHLAQALLAVGEGDAFLDDLGAERARRRDLGGVGVFWDEDQRGQSNCGRGKRDRLGVVAGADGDHAGVRRTWPRIRSAACRTCSAWASRYPLKRRLSHAPRRVRGAAHGGGWSARCPPE